MMGYNRKWKARNYVSAFGNVHPPYPPIKIIGRFSPAAMLYMPA
jgi:hypothetical protein